MFPIATLVASSAAMAAHALPGGAVHAALQPRVQVDGRVLLLAELAVLDGGSAASRATAGRVVLTAAPRPGEIVRLSRREIQRLLATAGASRIVVEGAETIEVRADGHAFDTARLVSAATTMLVDAMASAGQDFEITSVEEVPAIILPRGSITLQRRSPGAIQLRSRMTVGVDILIDGGFYQTISVSFNVKAVRQVLVAHREMAKGELANCDGFVMAARDVAAMPSATYARRCGPGLRLRRSVAAGSVLLQAELESMPAVSDGATIQLQVMLGAVMVETTALALTSGQMGQQIPVRPGTGQESIMATVVGPNLVQVRER